MIDRTELARARETIFASDTEGLKLTNAEARHAIQIFELTDRMVDADLTAAAEFHNDSPALAAAETAFDTAQNELLTLVKTARETPPPAKEAPQPCSSP